MLSFWLLLLHRCHWSCWNSTRTSTWCYCCHYWLIASCGRPSNYVYDISNKLLSSNWSQMLVQVLYGRKFYLTGQFLIDSRIICPFHFSWQYVSIIINVWYGSIGIGAGFWVLFTGICVIFGAKVLYYSQLQIHIQVLYGRFWHFVPLL